VPLDEYAERSRIARGRSRDRLGVL
jgi:hypothetical protein